MAECTIIVVSYNHAPFVRECLDSLAAQTEASPIIFADDFSTDDTLEIARAWFDEHDVPVTMLADGRNIGVCRRLNEALEHVRTPYYAYISTDDSMEPQRIEKQLKLFRSLPHHVVAVYSDAYLMDTDGTRWDGTFADHYPLPPVIEGDMFEQLITASWIPTPTVMLRTEAVRRVGGYNEALPFEDADMWLRLAKIGHFARINEPLASVRYATADSLTRQVMTRDQTAWRITQTRLLLGHTGHSTRGDQRILEAIRPVLPVLLLSTKHASEVRGLLRETTRRLPRVRFWIMRLMAELRLARPALVAYWRLRGRTIEDVE